MQYTDAVFGERHVCTSVARFYYYYNNNKNNNFCCCGGGETGSRETIS